MKILNLYAGIGGNRMAWGNEHEVTAVEISEEIAAQYKATFPKDIVVVTDAHQYLLDHYQEFDFIWSSPPCPTHSKLNYCMKLKRYPSMMLYQEIIFLQTWFKGNFVIENVKPYYKALIDPAVELGRHIFWSNKPIAEKKFTNIDISRCTIEELSEDLGIPIPTINKARLLLRNCLHPDISKHIFEEVNK